MISPTPSKFVCLVILDGWGIAPQGPGNAISQANTINMNRYYASFPHTLLQASGEAVGLPRGEPGNTETGHINLGAGRIVYQDLARINMSIADGSFYDSPSLVSAIEHAVKNKSNLHLMGLIGAGGVHSNMEHLYALVTLAKKMNFSNLFLHLFTDGRDSPQTSAKTYVNSLRTVIAKEGIGTIASIMGRYWAMDRDLRWERTAKAYFALTRGEGHLVKTPEEAIETSYFQGRTDEFIEPSIISDQNGKAITTIGNNDAVIFFNFRIDRPRQLTRAFVMNDFSKANLSFEFDPYMVKYAKKHQVPLPTTQQPFDRGSKLNNLYFVTMTEYEKRLSMEGTTAAFPPETVDMPIGKVISENEKRQLRMAESEKERFVTFYFNGQKENPFEGEDRYIIPSPKVPTYDLKPEMSASALTDSLLHKLRNSQQYSFVTVNYANPDMVAHTGNIGATVTACRLVDECIGQIGNFVLGYGGTLLITADHGNAEEMINPKTGEIDTEHNANPVPFIAVSQDFLGKTQMLPEGILADVAPTVLALLGIEPPSSMTGKILLEGLWNI
jgi:2,3-bisphosphoglycerate-independent phosphoglycerate mutase